MGRWIVLEEDDFVRDNSDGWCGSCASEDDAKNIARRHKQECDHYEQRIAELTAELARVKAESLRVVKCADDMPPLNLDTLVRHIHIDGHVVRLELWDRQC